MTTVLEYQDNQEDHMLYDYDEEDLILEYKNDQDRKQKFNDNFKNQLLYLEQILNKYHEKEYKMDEETYRQVQNDRDGCLAFEVDYQIKQKQEIIELLIGKLKKVIQFHKISLGRAFLLLRSQNYDVEKCQNISDQVTKIIYPRQEEHVYSLQDNSSCLICENPLQPDDKYSLECRHYFCKSYCFQEYINQALKSGNDIILKKCPMDGCREVLGLNDYIQFLKKPEQLKFILNCFVNDYVLNYDKLQFCPLVNCEKIFKFTDQSNQEASNLRCTCEKQFSCKSCKQEAHLPLTCQQKIKWDNTFITQDIKLIRNIQYIMNNTKACPKCKSPVEKNGGCQHMRCSQCQTHFCWACMQIYKNSLHTSRCMKTINYENDSYEIRSKKKVQKLQNNYLYFKNAVELSQKDSEKNIKFIQDQIEIVFKNENEMQEEMKLFQHSLNIILEAKIVYFNCIPLFYFEEDKQKVFFLEYLQENLETQLSQLEYHLTQEARIQFCLESFRKSEIQQIDFEEKYFSFKKFTKEKVHLLQQSLKNIIFQVSKNYPEVYIFNENQYELLEVLKVEKETLKKANSTEQAIQTIENSEINDLCDFCKQHPIDNDYGLCGFCLFTQFNQLNLELE